MHLNGRTTLLAATILLGILAAPAVGQPERGIKVGEGIKPRLVTTIGQEKLSIPAEEGLTVLLFWSTWSPRSSGAISTWQDYALRYKDHNISVYSVNADNQRMEASDIRRIKEYVVENSVTLPVIIDYGLELFNEIGIIVLPTTLIFTPDGTLDYRYAGFPSSARLDLEDDLEAKLGINPVQAAEEESRPEKPAYQPKNNALSYFGMGKKYEEKGYVKKAGARYIQALKRDPDYPDPLRSLEGIFFAQGQTPEAEERLKTLLTDSGLQSLVGRIQAKEETGEAAQVSAPASSPAEKKELTPMERMKILLEESNQQ